MIKEEIMLTEYEGEIFNVKKMQIMLVFGSIFQ